MIKKIAKSYDYPLLVAYLALTIFGLIMIYSASMVTSIQIYQLDDSAYFFKKQLGNFLISLVFLGFLAIFPYRIYKKNVILYILFFGSIIGLISLNYIGENVNAATSWIALGARSLQPSEFVKLFVIIYLSAVYAKKQSYINDFNRGVVPPILFLVLTCFLTAIQPDIGTAFIMFMTGAIIVVCSGMHIKNLLKLVGIALFMVVLFSPILLSNADKLFTEERLSRLKLPYTDPFEDELGEGYQLVNSYLAIGLGGWSGVGLGKSVQKLGYLPEAHTDFIMSIIAEELGIFGVSFVIILLTFIVLRSIRIGVKCEDPFGSLLAFGIGGMIGIQAIVNLGGISGLIPLTGVTLPFVSYGGSSLMVLSMSIGLLLNVSMFSNYQAKYGKNKTGQNKSSHPVKRVPTM